MSYRRKFWSLCKRNPVASALPGRVRITIRIDADILNWSREKVNERGGGDYQTMLNGTLRSCIQYQDKMLEETIRKVIQEELRAQG